MKNVPLFRNRMFSRDLVVIFVILITPFLFYLYTLVPDVENWETRIYNFNSNYYESVYVFFWVIATKLLLIILLIIWFFTCTHWWRNVLLIPLIIELYKLVGAINDDFKMIDEYDFLYSLPITLPIIALIYYLSIKLNFYGLNGNLEQELDEEIEIVINKLASAKVNDYKEKRKEFEALKKLKGQISDDEYVKQLVALKNGILIE